MGMTQEAVEARREYKRQYRSENREKINAQQREWRANNPAKVREYQERYWEKQVGKRNIRAGWQDYDISKDRLNELQEIIRSDEYASVVLASAIRADEKAAGHIILSVVQGVTYEHLEYHEKLGRCPLGRTNFYGVRRLFFHYLDCELRKMQNNVEMGNG